MSQTVIGIFEHENQAQEAKAYLVANGFNSQNIDINVIAGSNYDESSTSEQQEGGIGDRISNFFSSLFDSDEDANAHISAAKRGTTLTVYTTTEDQTSQAVQVLDNFGAVDVNDFAQSSDDRATTQVGTAGADVGITPLDTDLINTDVLNEDLISSNPVSTASDTVLPVSNAELPQTSSDLVNSGTNVNDNTGTAIPIIQEELNVGKKEIETGGVRVRSRIVTKPVQESVRLRTEHVNVERQPVDRPATESDFAAFQEGTVELTEHAEIPVVAKEARVVEEISLDKEVTETEQTINDTVRSTEIDTEDLNDKKLS
jgi:uncharacterized protein (TIGR02271 family)